jgi:hypothetical protein
MRARVTSLWHKKEGKMVDAAKDILGMTPFGESAPWNRSVLARLARWNRMAFMDYPRRWNMPLTLRLTYDQYRTRGRPEIPDQPAG